MKKIWMSAALTGALVLAGCGGGTQKTGVVEAPKTDAAVAAPDLENGATITGKVAFEGTAPVMRTLDMSAVPACSRAHTTPQKSEEVIVNPNNTVRNAFVWVKDGLPDKNWQVPTTPVMLEQTGCMYKPHVFGVMAGQNIEIKNSDPTNHNIHPQPQTNQDWNESQAPGSEDKMKSFPRQEVMIPIHCQVHNWMKAFVGVVSHPFFAVTGDDGTYTIKGLPPGTYTIQVWQEKFGAQEQKITVGAKDSKPLDFTIKAS